MPAKYRPDHSGPHRRPYERNARRVLASSDVCAICGKPIDKSLKYPHPLSPSVDHIEPISKGGHPSDLDNLQLTHLVCNRGKGNKRLKKSSEGSGKAEIIGPRVLPQSTNWAMYRSKEGTGG